jgi:undecaprenyl-diphosphatase
VVPKEPVVKLDFVIDFYFKTIPEAPVNLFQIILLACLQGFAELLPVSSSAHVIVAEKLMGLDPTLPEMTLLLVMLHTGTMASVLVYFGGNWKRKYFQTSGKTRDFLKQVAVATLATGTVGLLLKLFIEKIVLRGTPKAEVEMLFGNLALIAASLAATGILILFASALEKKTGSTSLEPRRALQIGLVQGLCLPFRGFSRSGATISTGLILGLDRILSEDFSFALAVVLTPAVILQEIHRLWKAQTVLGLPHAQLLSSIYPSLLGMVFSFLAGLLALKWLSQWLQQGRWKFFGIYCLVASTAVLTLFFLEG